VVVPPFMPPSYTPLVCTSTAYTCLLTAQPLPEPLKPLLLLQQHRHDDGLKRSRARHHDAGLDRELGAVKEPLEDGLIGLWQGSCDRGPSAAFPLDALTAWRQGLAHDAVLKRFKMDALRGEMSGMKGMMTEMLDELTTTHEDVCYVRTTVNMLVRNDAA
jgi:hypothetical protein